MKILISGSRGFIGSSIGNVAASQGHELLGLGRASQPIQGWPGTYLQTDIVTSNLSNTINDFRPDVVVHAAGTASVSNSYSAPLDDFRASALSWTNLLETVRRSAINPLVIYLGSAAVYGASAELPIRETAPIQPISPYGFHKAICELLAQEYAQCFGLRTVICRLFSVFGPTQRRLLVWDLYRAARDDENVSLKGTGNESRDYLHVHDVADALIQLGAKLRESNAVNEIVNIASGHETKVIDLAQMIRKRVAPGKQVITKGEVLQGDPQNWCADISRLQSLLPDWQPRTFDERLAECIDEWQHVGEP